MNSLSHGFITRALLGALVLSFSATAVAVVLEQWRVAGVLACLGAVFLAGLTVQVGRGVHRAVARDSRRGIAAIRAAFDALQNERKRELSTVLAAVEASERDIAGAIGSLQNERKRELSTVLAAVEASERDIAGAIGSLHELAEAEQSRISATADLMTSISGQMTELEQMQAEATQFARQRAGSQRSRDASLHSAVLTDMQAVLQLQQQFAPQAPLPVAAGWAISPTGVKWLVDLISRHSPQQIVECGSGTSTLWMALALREQGSGRLVTLEHQETFAEATRGTLALHEVTEIAEVRQAAMIDIETPLGARKWYDISSGISGQIDFVVVDGPPKSTGPLARYPALPALRQHLADGAIIVVDDANRPDELEMCELWLAQYPELRRVTHAAEDVHVYSWHGQAKP